MKRLLLTAAAASFLMACNVKSDNGFITGFSTKEGTGMMKTKQLEMNFDEIKVSQSISAEIVKADEEKVVVTAPEDIMEDILVDNEGGKLHIHFKPNLNISAKNVAVKIFAKDFSKVEANSSADIKIKDKFTQERTAVKVSSSGSISGNLEANDLSVEVSSSGDFSGQIWAVNFESEASSSGDITVSGKTKNADLRSSSSGTLDASKVVAQKATVSASSSGSVNVSVSDEVNASASSSGDISITKKGNLNVVGKKESSGGSVSIN